MQCAERRVLTGGFLGKDDSAIRGLFLMTSIALGYTRSAYSIEEAIDNNVKA